ncbi:AraC family transcriptional regulator [Pseudomonas chlororaphis]|uniref:helix-turn-helix domain-containing protein n=1 Tax=Pseudomonas chlororaphis TaxID=587753 RepID=UPI000F4A7268|nr:AraC family transcriptional regulator [Pseudomonas chlororaphis]RON94410.1 AraC family transcriptional regulator [Pseudomonas chlororaphis]
MPGALSSKVLSSRGLGHEPLRRELLGGTLDLQLLPRAAYSARDPLQWQSLGLSLERQQGVHAIGSDRREDFDSWPGTLALTPAGVEVFSESPQGGEYLLLRWLADPQALGIARGSQRLQRPGHTRALALGRQARRLLLEPAGDPLALEQCALQFAGLAAFGPAPAKAARRTEFSRVLTLIEQQYAEPLSLGELAACTGRNELRFLRDFTRAIGMTPHAWLVEVRVQAARRLIERSDLPLAAIALETGFAHQSHMGSAFRKVLGLTPSQYRAGF